MNESLRAELSDPLGSVDPMAAELVRRPDTQIQDLPAPYLRKYRLYRIESAGPPHRFVFTVAHAHGRAWLVSANVQTFTHMIEDDGARLADAGQALQYVTTFLQVTRLGARVFFLLKRFADIPFLPELEEPYATRVSDLRERYEPLIRPPWVRAEGEAFQATAYAVMGRDLVALFIDVARDCRIQVRLDVLEQELPLVFVV